MSEALDEVKRRCEVAGLHFDEEGGDPEQGIPDSLLVVFPTVRSGYPIMVQEGASARRLLEQPFETYKATDGFSASWSSEHKVIECGLDPATEKGTLIPGTSEYTRVLQKLGLKINEGGRLDPRQRAEFGSDTGLSISIGPCSTMHGIIHSGFAYDDDLDDDLDAHRFLTLQIRGVEVSAHDTAVEVLRRVGNSLLFQLHLRGLTLRLEREPIIHDDFDEYDEHHMAQVWRYIEQATEAVGSLPPLRFEYDDQPMSLYWYGMEASGMPLLQFLAYYQTIEYYFPVYSKIEAQTTLRNILKDPTFDPTRDSDVARLLDAIKVGSGGRTFGNEADQLEATIRHCVTAEDLRNFLISEDASRYKFYTSGNAKKVVREKVPVREKADDHRGAVAKRVYAIRNRIVHTKGAYGDQEPLFPFDPEVKYLFFDIHLVEFLARKVLIASSRPLRV